MSSRKDKSRVREYGRAASSRGYMAIAFADKKWLRDYLEMIDKASPQNKLTFGVKPWDKL